MSNIFIPNSDALTQLDAPLKTVGENGISAANDYFIQNSASGFSSITPHLYNKVFLIRTKFQYDGNFKGMGLFFDRNIITNAYARSAFTGVGLSSALTNPASQFYDDKYEDWCFYYELTPISELKKKRPNVYDTEFISTSFKYSPKTGGGSTGITISTPENEMGINEWGIITKPNETPQPTENYNDWLYVTEWSFFNRALGATTDRVKLVKTSNTQTVAPSILWDMQNFFWYSKTGSKPKARNYSGGLQGITMLNPQYAKSLTILGNWRLIASHTLTDTIGNETIFIDNQFLHKSLLGENIKFLAVEEDDWYFDEWAKTENESVYLPRLLSNTSHVILAFKNEEALKQLLSDWGVTRATSDSEEAASMPAELFPGVSSDDDTIIPDGGESTGYDTNPSIPSIPSYSDNTSDKIIPTTPNISAINAASVYALSLAGVKSFLRWLITDDFTKNISELFGDKLSAINDLKLFPFDVVTHDTLHAEYSDSLTIANVTGAVNCYKIQPYYNCILNGGEYHYTAYWGDYNDYTSASYYLYIPYGGIVELSPSFVVNRDLKILYALDIMTGNATAIIYSNRVLVKTVPCEMGQTVPITYTNTNQREIKNALTALNAGTSLINVAAGKTDILSGVLNIGSTVARTALTNPLQIGSIGNFSANTSLIMPQNPFLIISRIQQSIPSNMDGIIGKPSNTFNNISAFVGSGFVQINANHINTTATTAEQEQIINLLRTGIFI